MEHPSLTGEMPPIPDLDAGCVTGDQLDPKAVIGDCIANQAKS
jgi:hypothetical protein